MFSGIVEEVGRVKNISRSGRNSEITVEADKVIADTKIGDSIAVNGVCLTVVGKLRNLLTFDAVPETSSISTLGGLKVSDPVNLERSLKVGDRISGHFVLGHVDCTGIIRKKGYAGGNLCFEIAVPPKFMKYIIPKGSVALDGISLTIADKKSNAFTVYIIPHTLENTILKLKGPSQKVNIEFDMLLKRV